MRQVRKANMKANPAREAAAEEAKYQYQQQYDAGHKQAVKALKGPIDMKSLQAARNGFFQMFLAASKMSHLLDNPKDWEEKKRAAEKSHHTVCDFIDIFHWGRNHD